ncbi:hypothetical protein AXX17_ATUG02320 [Arabidopsis thaliana]|uniref:Uncharacterized protein n=1 Tax=Arabidopsis thaliana TaxID=3702 RepID=A0A178U7X7_ARATH|nr:hypothetical protein AXX17_ATUG02320 [Arabidopsis thaliana]
MNRSKGSSHLVNYHEDIGRFERENKKRKQLAVQREAEMANVVDDDGLKFEGEHHGVFQDPPPPDGNLPANGGNAPNAAAANSACAAARAAALNARPAPDFWGISNNKHNVDYDRSNRGGGGESKQLAELSAKVEQLLRRDQRVVNFCDDIGEAQVYQEFSGNGSEDNQAEYSTSSSNRGETEQKVRMLNDAFSQSTLSQPRSPARANHSIATPEKLAAQVYSIMKPEESHILHHLITTRPPGGLSAHSALNQTS